MSRFFGHPTAMEMVEYLGHVASLQVQYRSLQFVESQRSRAVSLTVIDLGVLHFFLAKQEKTLIQLIKPFS